MRTLLPIFAFFLTLLSGQAYGESRIDYIAISWEQFYGRMVSYATPDVGAFSVLVRVSKEGAKESLFRYETVFSTKGSRDDLELALRAEYFRGVVALLPPGVRSLPAFSGGIVETAGALSARGFNKDPRRYAPLNPEGVAPKRSEGDVPSFAVNCPAQFFSHPYVRFLIEKLKSCNDGRFPGMIRCGRSQRKKVEGYFTPPNDYADSEVVVVDPTSWDAVYTLIHELLHAYQYFCLGSEGWFDGATCSKAVAMELQSFYCQGPDRYRASKQTDLCWNVVGSALRHCNGKTEEEVHKLCLRFLAGAELQPYNLKLIFPPECPGSVSCAASVKGEDGGCCECGDSGGLRCRYCARSDARASHLTVSQKCWKETRGCLGISCSLERSRTLNLTPAPSPGNCARWVSHNPEGWVERRCDPKAACPANANGQSLEWCWNLEDLCENPIVVETGSGSGGGIDSCTPEQGETPSCSEATSCESLAISASCGNHCTDYLTFEVTQPPPQVRICGE